MGLILRFHAPPPPPRQRRSRPPLERGAIERSVRERQSPALYVAPPDLDTEAVERVRKAGWIDIYSGDGETPIRQRAGKDGRDGSAPKRGQCAMDGDRPRRALVVEIASDGNDGFDVDVPRQCTHRKA